MEDKERCIKIAVIGGESSVVLAAIESAKLINPTISVVVVEDFNAPQPIQKIQEETFMYELRPPIPDIYIPRRINTDPFYYQFKNKRRKKH